MTFKQPSGPLFRTVVHIGSTNAAGITAESGVISAIWGEFNDLNVTRWNGGDPLVYRHKRYGVVVPYHDTSGLLAHGHGQCDSWQDLLYDALKAQGVTASLIKKQIVPNEGDVFIVKHNWNWGNPATFTGAPTGYDWKYGENLHDGPGTDLPGQGNTAPGYLSTEMRSVFENHFPLEINGMLYDPAYGQNFANLAAWEAAAVVGAGVDWGGNEFARKRVSGDVFTRFE